MKKIKCETCLTEFEPTEKQVVEIEKSANAGIERFIIDCPKCHSIVFVFPLMLLGKSTVAPKEIEDDRLFCCPVSACIGFVEENKDAKVFGCSECGTEWRTLDKVHQSIEQIIEKYPHRKKVYQKNGEQWKSISLDEIPKGYYSKVNNEKV
ncbi:hypothetical protein [Pedobacter agri]|uniref:hypothetical protein n=1 Tax=Pedobacter agri TaxID=454586 RepID=UPI002931C03B|nr:hypothetical protein [Pedobacter agri]